MYIPQRPYHTCLRYEAMWTPTLPVTTEGSSLWPSEQWCTEQNSNCAKLHVVQLLIAVVQLLIALVQLLIAVVQLLITLVQLLIIVVQLLIAVVQFLVAVVQSLIAVV